MFRIHIKNCKTCKHFYRDGNYNPHCKEYLNAMKIIDTIGSCSKWEEKTFSKLFGFVNLDKSTIEI